MPLPQVAKGWKSLATAACAATLVVPSRIGSYGSQGLQNTGIEGYRTHRIRCVVFELWLWVQGGFTGPRFGLAVSGAGGRDKQRVCISYS